MKHSPHYIKYWQDKYITALLDAIGAAALLGLETEKRQLFEMSRNAMGLTSPRKRDTMQTGTAKTGGKQNGGKNMEHLVKITVNGDLLGTVRTNRSLTVTEALWALGYDLNDAADIERGYNNDIPGFYLDDCGNYQFDIDAVKMEY